MTPRNEVRDQRFAMVMTLEERTMLDALAEADSRSASDWVRMAIKAAHAERFPKKTTPSKK